MYHPKDHLQTTALKALPINKATPLQALTAGTNTLTLMNYVQGELVAIKDQNIVAGDFTAIATFALDYP